MSRKERRKKKESVGGRQKMTDGEGAKVVVTLAGWRWLRRRMREGQEDCSTGRQDGCGVHLLAWAQPSPCVAGKGKTRRGTFRKF